jgi:hypothetical protein
MAKQPDQRELVVTVVFGPDDDALIICGVVEHAFLVLKPLELTFDRVRVEGVPWWVEQDQSIRRSIVGKQAIYSGGEASP